MQFDTHFKDSGQGKSFVFQHGLGSQSGQPQGLLGGLTGFRLISMDCPGHGKSALPKEYEPSFNNYTDDVIRLMDHLGIESAIWGGISMGSGIAVNAALRYPNRVKALVLVRPAWIDASTPQNLVILKRAAQLIGKSGGRSTFMEDAEYQQIERLLPKAAASVMGVFADTQQQVLPLVLERLVDDFPFPSLGELNKIQLPCLLLANEDDPLHPIEMAKIIQRHIPGSVFQEVTSRYVSNEKHGQEVRKAVAEFLENL